MPPVATGSRRATNATCVQSLKPSGVSSGGVSTGSLRPGSSVAFAKPGSSLTIPTSGGSSDSNGVTSSNAPVSGCCVFCGGVGRGMT